MGPRPEIWRQTTPRAFAMFLITVGVTFSSMGFLGDIVLANRVLERSRAFGPQLDDQTIVLMRRGEPSVRDRAFDVR